MFLKIFSKSIDTLTAILSHIASFSMLCACVICCANAFSRYLFGLTSNFFLEIQWYFFGAMFMLAAAHVLKLNEHVRVDLIYHHLSPRARLWVELFGIAAFLLPFCLLGGYLTARFFWESWRISEESGNAAGLVRWPAKLLFPVGFGVLALQGLSEGAKIVLALKGNGDALKSYEKPLQ